MKKATISILAVLMMFGCANNPLGSDIEGRYNCRKAGALDDRIDLIVYTKGKATLIKTSYWTGKSEEYEGDYIKYWLDSEDKWRGWYKFRFEPGVFIASKSSANDDLTTVTNSWNWGGKEFDCVYIGEN